MKKRHIRSSPSGNAYVISTTRPSVGVLVVLCVVGLLSAKNSSAQQAKTGAATDSTFVIGAGVGSGPRYSGSDQNVVKPLLLLDYSNPNGFFISTARGIGYSTKLGSFSYSAALNYRGGRSENDRNNGFSDGSSRLRGMGDIERSINSILGWGYSPAEWLDLNVRADLAVSQRNNGNAFHFTVSSPFYADAKDKLSLATTASLGDSKYMQTYYGVTALQQENSGFNAFTPKSGIYQVSANLNWTHQFDAKWALHTTVRMTRLQGDAAKSPLTGRRLAPNAVMFVTYAY